MKNNNNKYILLFILLASAFRLFPIFSGIILSNYGEEIPIIIKSNLKIILGISIVLPDIAAAFWLRYLAKKENSSQLLWFFFGLMGGLISVAIFYLIRINEKLETQQSNPLDSE